MYYWAIKWKQFNEEPLLVNEKVKDYIQAQWDLPKEQRESQTFKYKGEQYSYDSIDRIVTTTKKILDSQKLLYAAGQNIGKKVPIINEDGDVVTAWYKRYVSNKEYEQYYAKHHNYKVVEKEDGGVWVGFRKVLHENEDISTDLELCTEEEADKLWKSATSF